MLKRTFIYTIAFAINWGPENINKIYIMASGEDLSFAFYVVYTAISPLRGFIDFLAYLYTRSRPSELANMTLDDNDNFEPDI